MSKKKFKVYDEIIVDKLREIEPATMKQLAKVLDQKSSETIRRMLKRLCREELIYVDIRNKPYIYRVKMREVSYD